ncbi:hypothetical protein GCM10009000_066740 [Halobacterium noricense]
MRSPSFAITFGKSDVYGPQRWNRPSILDVEAEATVLFEIKPNFSNVFTVVHCRERVGWIDVVHGRIWIRAGDVAANAFGFG